jgi:hypothetical protein
MNCRREVGLWLIIYGLARPAKKWTLGACGKSLFDVARLDDIFDFESRFILSEVKTGREDRSTCSLQLSTGCANSGALFTSYTG